MDPLKALLQMEIKQPKIQSIKITSISNMVGEDVNFKIRELGYNKVKEIKEVNSGPYGDMAIAILLEGIVEPNLKDASLLEKYDAITPGELIPKLLSAGEIEDICSAIERLSGYRQSTIEMVEDIKKK